MDFARSNYCSDYKSIEEKNRKKKVSGCLVVSNSLRPQGL